MYRQQDSQELCTACRALCETRCCRCALPFCTVHLPADDQRCSACEQDWMIQSARRELHTWGPGSRTFVAVAKWSARLGSVGLVATVLCAVSGLKVLLPLVILLLGFPVAIAALIGLALSRGAERALDAGVARHRRAFLAQRLPRALPGPVPAAPDPAPVR